MRLYLVALCVWLSGLFYAAAVQLAQPARPRPVVITYRRRYQPGRVEVIRLAFEVWLNSWAFALVGV
jgi:hypothetical protein